MADGEVGEAPGPVLVRHPPLTHPGHQLALLLPRQRAVRPDVVIAPPSLETFLVNHPFCRFQAHPPLEGVTPGQGGITCGAIEDPRKSSKAIDERVIINFRDKNGVIARFRDKNVVIVRFCDKNVLSIASLFYR